MHTPLPLLARLAAILGATAALSAGARAEEPAAIQPAMLTMAQAVTLAEVTQNGTAFDMRRAAAGTDVVYHIKVSTPDRGIVKVQVAAYGGRVAVRPQSRRGMPA